VAKRGTLNHPKNQRLAKALKTAPGLTLGLLETIWEWAATYQPTGRLTAHDLEEALDYGKWRKVFRDYSRVIEALIDPAHRWLDPLDNGAYGIHNWPKHATDGVHAMLYRNIMTFYDGSKPLQKKISAREREKLAKLWAIHDSAAAVGSQNLPIGPPTTFTSTFLTTSTPSPAAASGPPVPESVFHGRGGEDESSDPLHGFGSTVKAQAVAAMSRYVERRFGTEANVPATYDRRRDLRGFASALEEDPPGRMAKLSRYFDHPTLPRHAPVFRVLNAAGLGLDEKPPPPKTPAEQLQPDPILARLRKEREEAEKNAYRGKVATQREGAA
jgi:hypothetical protein